MRIERHNQLGRGDTPPHPEVDTVSAHHPSQVEVEPLAGAARGWLGKEIPDTGRAGGVHKIEGTGTEGIKGRSDIVRIGSIPSEKEPLD